MSDNENFKLVLEQKEREIIGLCEQQINALQQQITCKESELDDLQVKFLHLQDDFKYNLKLLEQRDVELKEYDASTISLQAMILKDEKELKEEKQKLSEVLYQIAQEKARGDEREQYWGTNHNIMKEQIEELKKWKEEKLKKLHSLEMANADLSHQVAEKQMLLESRSKEMETHYMERINNQKLEAQVRIEDAFYKLSLAEERLMHLVNTKSILERDLEAALTRERLKNQQEMELHACITDKEAETQTVFCKLKLLEKELDNTRIKSQVDERQMTSKIEYLETGYKKKITILKEDMERLRFSIGVAEDRINKYEIEKLQQIGSLSEKLSNVESEIIQKDKYWKQKLEVFQIIFQDQERNLEELKDEGKRWREMHDAMQRKYVTVEKQYLDALEHQRFPVLKNLNREKNKNAEKALTANLPSPLLSPSMSPSVLHQLDISWPPDLDINSSNTVLDLENQELKDKIHHLQEQNERMKRIIETMRLEMEAVQKRTSETCQPTLNQTIIEMSGLSRDTPEASYKDMQQDEIKHMRGEIHYLTSKISDIALHLQGSQNGQMGVMANEENDGPKDHLAKSNNTQRASSTNEVDNKIAELRTVQTSLRMQLEAAASDISRLTNERDTLMELSNSLRAELNRLPISEIANINRRDYSDEDAKCENVSRLRSHDGNPRQRGNINQSLLLEGNASVQHYRPPGLEQIMHKGTASQHARLRASIKRKEDMKLEKPKLRNYNMRNDNMEDV